jgi:DnaK suppressor protein
MSTDVDFLEEMRALLEERREAIARISSTTSEAAATVELDQARLGRLSRMDAMQSQAMAKEIGRRNQRELTAIEEALRRIDEGEYGLCRRCEMEIAEARLRANPATPLCIDCADAGGRR